MDVFFKNNRDRTYTLTLDPSGRELLAPGLELFNVAVHEFDQDAWPYATSRVIHHWHEELEIFLLTAGGAWIEAGDQRHRLEAGQGCFINSGVLHAVSGVDDRPYAYRSFVFDAGIVGGAPGSVFDIRTVRPLLENGPRYLPVGAGPENEAFFRQFGRVFEACRDEPSGYEFLARDALSQLLLFLKEKSRVALAGKISTQREERVKAMLRWLGDHLGEEVTVGDVAAVAAIGERECYRLFQQYLRCGPIEYLNRRRVLEAAKRLSSTDDPITAIALDCGFPTPSYFTKRFKRQLGKTPREYRAAARGD